MSAKDLRRAIAFVDDGDAEQGRLELPGLTLDEAGKLGDYVDKNIVPTRDGYRVEVIKIEGVYCVEIYPEPD